MFFDVQSVIVIHVNRHVFLFKLHVFFECFLSVNLVVVSAVFPVAETENFKQSRFRACVEFSVFVCKKTEFEQVVHHGASCRQRVFYVADRIEYDVFAVDVAGAKRCDFHIAVVARYTLDSRHFCKLTIQAQHLLAYAFYALSKAVRRERDTRIVLLQKK